MMQPATSVQRWLASITAAILLMIANPAIHAQEQQPQTGDADLTERDQIVADRLTLYAIQNLQGDGNVPDFQYDIADTLLQDASQLAPDDLTIWHLRAELAAGIQDSRKREQALRQIIRIDPDDQATKLDLIFLLLERVQTLDERLKRVESLIARGPDSGLSDPLLSRLAVYAAASARELDDLTKFRDYLKLAVSLDPANDSAFRMTLDFAIERDRPNLTRAAIAMQLIAAAPIDRGARLELGNLFLQEGCYDEAANQLFHGTRLSLSQTPAPIAGSLVVSLLGSGQTENAAAYLEQLRYTHFPGEPDEEGNPTPGPLPLQFKILQLLTFLHAEDPEQRQQAFTEVETALRNADDNVSLPALGRLAAIFNFPEDDLIARADEIEQQAPNVAELLRAQDDLNHQRVREAADRLLLIAPDEPAARIIQARFPGISPRRARQLYASAVASGPEELAAVVAGLEHQKIFNENVAPTRDGERMNQLLLRYPSQLWKLIDNFMAWTDIELTFDKGGRYELLEPMNANLEIANLTSMPITFGGSGGAINNVAIVSGSVSVMGKQFASIRPLILDIDRSITLEAGQRINVPVNLSHSMLAGISADNPFTTLSADFNAVLDPRPTQWGGIAPGPLGTSTNVRGIAIRGTPPTPERLDVWIEQLGNLETREQLVAAIRVLHAATEGLIRGLNEEQVGKATGELIQAYRRARPEAQIYVVLAMPPGADQGHLLQPILDDAATASDPRVRIAYCLRHVNDPADRHLIAAINSNDPHLARFASAYQKLLQLIQDQISNYQQQQRGQQPPKHTGGYIGLPTPEELLKDPETDDPFGTPNQPEE